MTSLWPYGCHRSLVSQDMFSPGLYLGVEHLGTLWCHKHLSAWFPCGCMTCFHVISPELYWGVEHLGTLWCHKHLSAWLRCGRMTCFHVISPGLYWGVVHLGTLWCHKHLSAWLRCGRMGATVRCSPARRGGGAPRHGGRPGDHSNICNMP